MPSTDFDTLVGKGGDSGKRKEETPFLFASLHTVPKQISDSSQSIGVNERTLKNGLMSGVILPSQIAHDRWLSIIDGAVDAIIIFIILLYLSFASWGTAEIVVVVLSSLYMFFHILWWENSMQWFFIETIKDYITQTRTYYYGAIIAFYLIFSSFGMYYIYEKNIVTSVNNMTVTVKNAVSKLDVISNYKSDNKTATTESKKANINKFSNEETYSTPKDIKKIDDTKASEEIEFKNEYFFYFYTYSIILAVLFVITFIYSSRFYFKKKIKNMDGVEVELKSELEQKMALLKEQF